MPLLTKKYIESLTPKDKVYFVWDSSIKGFGCAVYPTKRKVYYYKYRNLERKQVKLTLGQHGLFTLDMARKKVSDILNKINNGTDPHAEKKKKKVEEKQSMFFKDFWVIFNQKYIEKNHKPSTIYKNQGRIKNYILPFFGSKELSKINRQDILSFVDTMPHAEGNLSSCLQLLSKAFNQAEIWEMRQPHTNPTKGVEKKPSKKMERFLTKKEQDTLEEILDFFEKHTKWSSYRIKAIWLLLYTGCREGEVTQLKWEDVHLKEKYIYFKDSKTGTKTVPLNDKAIEILKSVKKKETNPYVFCGKRPNTPIPRVDSKLWQLIRKKAGIPDVRIHDLRHSFASFALKKGVDLYTVSKLLGHKNIATTTRYAHLELDALKEATNKIFE